MVDGERVAASTVQACGDGYPCFSPVWYGADVVLPIVDFGQDSEWRPDSTQAWGTFGVWFRWIVIVVGWALASVFVAAFTNLVRRD